MHSVGSTHSASSTQRGIAQGTHPEPELPGAAPQVERERDLAVPAAHRLPRELHPPAALGPDQAHAALPPRHRQDQLLQAGQQGIRVHRRAQGLARLLQRAAGSGGGGGLTAAAEYN